ncbi:hypothetical protein OC834_002562 [Tilletia horrida]|nr:hypothetical protein OC834_002562 [Tilletia horrida]
MSGSGAAARGARDRGGGGGWAGASGSSSAGRGHGQGQGRGRGAYYKALYGGGGSKRARMDLDADADAEASSSSAVPGSSRQQDRALARPWTELESFFHSREGKPYPAYRDLLGCVWAFPNTWAATGSAAGAGLKTAQWTLQADSVQADPFAPPSHFRAFVPHAVARVAPPDVMGRIQGGEGAQAKEAGPAASAMSSFRRTAIADFLLRRLVRAFQSATDEWDAYVHSAASSAGGWGSGWSSGKGGQLEIDAPGQQILDRSALRFGEDGMIEVRFRVGLPAKGRSILGREAHHLFTSIVPRALEQGLSLAHIDPAAFSTYLASAEDSHALQAQLRSHNLVTFIGNGSVLPRASGASDEPLPRDGAVESVSPQSLETTLKTPHRGEVRGLGLRKGTLTVLIGGGFHGKSTLLEAIAAGVYVHKAGDGRELVSTVDTAMLIQSEDGRSVSNVDISPFIKYLPSGKSTTAFSTKNASGSTSCSASLIEALELGSELILIDEDTTAANWLQREAAMAQLVLREPISPFVDHVRALVDGGQRSVVLVCGSSTHFLKHADHVLLLEDYRLRDVTEDARKLFPKEEVSAPPTAFPSSTRVLDLKTFPSSPRFSKKSIFEVPRGTCQIRVRNEAFYRDEQATPAAAVDEDLSLDLRRHVPHVVSPSQARAIAAVLNQLPQRVGEWGHPLSSSSSKVPLRTLVDGIDALMGGGGGEGGTGAGVEMLQYPAGSAPEGNLARPRKVDIGAVLNRLRVAQFK